MFCRFFSRSLTILTIPITFLFSCRSDISKNELAVYKALNVSLETSNQSLNKSNQLYLLTMAEKLNDPTTNPKATIWLPKAEAVNELSKGLYEFLETLKWELKSNAGMKNNQDVDAFRVADKGAVFNLFEKDGKGKELEQRLKKYKEDLFAVDRQLDSAFKEATPVSVWTAEGAVYMVRNCFSEVPAIAALSMLNKIENDVRITENRAIDFFNNKCNRIALCGWDMYAVMVGQSSTILRPGEKLELTTGVGRFVNSAKPGILVNGKAISVDPSGTATYKMKVPTKPGKYFVPLKVSYTDQEGKIQVIEKNVEYTVQDIPCPDN